MSDYDWDTRFTALFDRCLERYRSGDHDFAGYYSDDDLAFLGSIGCRPREFFDFVEDLVEEGEPSRETALLVASVRRDYFRTIQNGVRSDRELTEPELPVRDAGLAGFAWLPRMLAKARAKLRGELHPDIMFSCGGDRSFLRSHGVHPSDFLRVVWAAGDDDTRVAAYVRECAERASEEAE